VDYSIGFIGGGKMAEAIISGIVTSNLISQQNVFVGEINEARQKYLQEVYGVNVSSDNKWVISQADLVILAVKPQLMQRVVGPLREIFSHRLVVSIAAGITINKLSEMLPDKQPIIRVMPNTPCLIGQGISAMAPGETVTEEHSAKAKTILSSVGQVVITEEKYLNAVTGLSGSGPAYVYLIIEALADAGVLAGLDRHMALQLATQTVIGSAAMVKETGSHPAQLKDAVTSPGGTTISALYSLEKNGVRAALIEAVITAMNRAAELNGE